MLPSPTRSYLAACFGQKSCKKGGPANFHQHEWVNFEPKFLIKSFEKGAKVGRTFQEIDPWWTNKSYLVLL